MESCPRCGFDETKNLTTIQIIERVTEILAPHGYCVLQYGIGPDGMLMVYHEDHVDSDSREGRRKVRALLEEHDDHEDVHRAMISTGGGGHVEPEAHHPKRFTCVRCKRMIDVGRSEDAPRVDLLPPPEPRREVPA